MAWMPKVTVSCVTVQKKRLFRMIGHVNRNNGVQLMKLQSWNMQALESAVRKKKQIVLNEEELKQQRSRQQSPEKPSLLQRMLLTVRRGGGAQALEHTIAALREEVLARIPQSCTMPKHLPHAHRMHWKYMG